MFTTGGGATNARIKVLTKDVESLTMKNRALIERKNNIMSNY